MRCGIDAERHAAHDDHAMPDEERGHFVRDSIPARRGMARPHDADAPARCQPAVT